MKCSYIRRPLATGGKHNATPQLSQGAGARHLELPRLAAHPRDC